MTLKWFGRKYDAPIYHDCPEVSTPVGEDCVRCTEPIAEGEDGFLYANGPAAHRECFIRGAVGSIRHQQGLCSCFIHGAGPDNEYGDRLTVRQEAKAAVQYSERRRRM